MTVSYESSNCTGTSAVLRRYFGPVVVSATIHMDQASMIMI